MSDQQPDRTDEQHPILSGLVALIGVGLAVGLVLALVVFAGVHMLGLGGGSGAGAATEERSMYLPRPSRTPTPTGPQITLAPAGRGSHAGEGGKGGGSAGRHHGRHAKGSKAKKKQDEQISLSASTTQVTPMESFDLSGVYPGGEGAILTVQRFQNGGWADFPATGSVSNETFQIPVQTSQAGENRFRVVDSDSGLQSNEVRVTVGG